MSDACPTCGYDLTVEPSPTWDDPGVERDHIAHLEAENARLTAERDELRAQVARAGAEMLKWAQDAGEAQRERDRLRNGLRECRDALRDDTPEGEMAHDSAASWVLWRLDALLAQPSDLPHDPGPNGGDGLAQPSDTVQPACLADPDCPGPSRSHQPSDAKRTAYGVPPYIMGDQPRPTEEERAMGQARHAGFIEDAPADAERAE